MKRPILILIILASTLTAMAQATQPCIVKQYNQKQQKTPLEGVQVEVRGAQTATSAANGSVTLQFATLKPGDRVPFRAATKAGFELMNKTAVEQWNISRDQKPFEIVLIQSAYFTQLKGKLKQSSVDSYHEKYEKARAELEKLQKEGKLKEQEYYDKLNELEDRYDNQLKNLDAYVDQFARIDLSELSEQEQQFIELAHTGRLDEAAEAYNALNAAGKYITAVENVRRLNEDIAKLEDEKARQQETADAFYAMLQRQVNTLKLAGGEENYNKAGDLLKRAALADTTNVEVVWEYADFAYNQHDFKDAVKFYLICLDNIKDNLFLKSSLQNNLGNLYCALHDYAKAEVFLLKAMENRNNLFLQNPEAYLSDLADTQNNLALLFSHLHNTTKAEEYYHKALDSESILFLKNPDVYRKNIATMQNNIGEFYYAIHDYNRAEEFLNKALENYSLLYMLNPNTYRFYLANVQNCLGNLYCALHDYAKAEEHYLTALENRTQLFNLNPDAYREDFASTQNNLGVLFKNLRNYTMAEKYYLKAEENYNVLFTQNPKAYSDGFANILFNIGNVYNFLNNFTKSEEYHLKSLSIRNQMFSQNSNVYRTNLANSQTALGMLYNKIQKYGQAEVFLLKALENFTNLFSQNPEEHRADLSKVQNNLGVLYNNLRDYAKAEAFYLKALENQLLLFTQYPDVYRVDLAMIQNSLGLMYFNLQKYDQSEKYYLNALENYTYLSSLNPNIYCSDLAITQNNLGNLYFAIHNYEKSEDFLLKAMINYTQLFSQKPDIYRAGIAMAQWNLIRLYGEQMNWGKHDEILNQALLNYEELYRTDSIYKDNLIILRLRKGTRLMTESHLSEAVSCLESAYQLDEEKTTPILADAYYSQAYSFSQNENFTKAMETIDKAIKLMPDEKKYSEFKNVIQILIDEKQQ